MIKNSLILTLLVVALMGSPVRAEKAWETALSTDVTGKGGWFTCLNYSKDLFQRMTCRGHEAHLIIYEWKDESRTVGRHAFVVFKDEEGRFYGMDNRVEKPIWLMGDKPQDWVNSFAHGASNVVIRHYYDPRTVGLAIR